MDNVPAELVKTAGEAAVDIWQTCAWPISWTQSLVITLQKKGNLQMCQNYHTISLISHVIVILNRLKPKVENIIAEEHSGFRAGRSTTEQIFNLVRKVSPTSAGPIPCFHLLQRGF